MARTAPVPNFPAIPGMNPGLFVLGGGGDGGGSGAGGGKGKDGKQGAGGKNGGNDANGDGKGAAGCGAGSGGGCSNPQHGGGGRTTAGDPVDVATGIVFTEPVLDLVLGGPLPLAIERFYALSRSERDVGLGYGWSHTLAWELQARRRTIEIQKPSGEVEIVPMPDLNATAQIGPGATLFRDEAGFALTSPSGLVRWFRPASDDGHHVLTSVADHNGNTIHLRYEAGQLSEIEDCVGRTVRVRRGSDGRIRSFEVKNAAHQGAWVSFRRYEIDDRGDLVADHDATGCPVRYAYDDEHRLTEHARADGLTVHYRYAEDGRCVETWADVPGGTDPSLDADVPSVLADGTTPAKGMFHVVMERGPDGLTVVTDSRQVRRYEHNAAGKVEKAAWSRGVHTSAYGPAGQLASYTNPNGATWLWEHDSLGRLVREVDPVGAESRIEHDAALRRVRTTTPSGNVIEREIDAAGNVIAVRDTFGPVIQYVYDPRGQVISATLSDGGTTRMEYDAHGNRTLVAEPHGVVRRISYDHLGRARSYVDERNQERHYTYDDRGLLRSITDSAGLRRTFEHDAAGRLVRMINPDRCAYELVWGGLNLVNEVRRPDGTSIRYRYDREGDLVRIINARGEEHRIFRDAGGRVVSERTFDGRSQSYKLDDAGNIVAVTAESGARTDISLDAAGRVVKREYDDGTSDEFEYDELGRVVAARGDGVECAFEYDARGRRVRERQTVGDATVEMRSAYDDVDRRLSLASSLGHVAQMERDLGGAVRRIVLDGQDAISFERDTSGFEVARLLPSGGRVETGRDAFGQRVLRRVLRAGAPPHQAGAEPSWVGAAPPGTTDETRYACAPGMSPTSESDARGITRFTYDALGQLLAKVPRHARAELFHYDAAGDVYEGGGSGASPHAQGSAAAAPAPAVTRTYEAGGRLARRGDETYAYDADGRLVEKRAQGPAGTTRVWRYTWNGRGLLAAVETPSGERVRFGYDPFARRTTKSVDRPDGTTTTVRYVYDAAVLIHELRKDAGAAGDPIVEERTYTYEPDTDAPLAHVVARRDEGREEPSARVFYLNATSCFPERLVAADGEIVAQIERAWWGEVPDEAAASTPLRFAGQYEDRETGLFYNRHRYYDPRTGRYISPDPIGLEGGLEAFNYARNRPDVLVDPDGLVTSTSYDPQGNPTGTATSGGTHDIHPVVQAAMPPMAGGRYPTAGVNGPTDVPGRPPGGCAEPQLISDRIRDYERANGMPPNSLQPNNPAHRGHIQSALGGIGGIASQQGSTPRAPCPNCSQMIATLSQEYNVPLGQGVQPGYGPPSNPGAAPFNFSPPDDAWFRAQSQASTGVRPGQSTDPSYMPHRGYP